MATLKCVCGAGRNPNCEVCNARDSAQGITSSGHHESVEPAETPVEDLDSVALDVSFRLYELLKTLKEDTNRKANARLWAIAVTEAEKLHAWIGYVMATVDEVLKG
jgi:hypothetical protein